MPRYRTTFERINFGITPPLKQTADVVFETDAPFTDATSRGFTEAAWAECFKQNPHWSDPSGPSGIPTGWSSVLGGSRFEPVDEAANASVAWHIPSASWLKDDGVTPTIDVDEAGRFSQAQIIELQKSNPGERYSMVQPKLLSEVYGPNGERKNRLKLQIVHADFVIWGYGPRSSARERMELATTHCAGLDFEFELPKASAGQLPAQEYERRRSWAWRFGNFGDNCCWALVDSKETAIAAAQKSAVCEMRSSGHRYCEAWLATKHNVVIVDKFSQD